MRIAILAPPWFPVPPSGYGGIKYLILPALALGSRSIAFLARVTRSAMLDVLVARSVTAFECPTGYGTVYSVPGVQWASVGN